MGERHEWWVWHDAQDWTKCNLIVGIGVTGGSGKGCPVAYFMLDQDDLAELIGSDAVDAIQRTLQTESIAKVQIDVR